ncbi:amidase [Acinetobacter sp. MB5]|uniref:amidase n=1 Tax=Acinetobacter sp. MB5 TaxID=2069438 RepID=UPI000DCF9973|nr:amidase [Acinetobacter sp. MB5]
MHDVQDAVSFSQQFLQQRLDPVQALEHALEKANQNDSVYIRLCEERAFREAWAAKARWDAGQPLSIFDGVPISWKDLYDLQGMQTTAGSAVLANSAMKKHDAVLVNQLTQLGMVNLGKTNLSEFAYSGLGLNPFFGTPKNVYDPACIPGGSSSGAAISVGHGSVPIGMGSDTGGSVRIPAALNGLVGYRSSHGRYSKQGVFELSKTLDTLGPLTHSVRDCWVLDQLITGNNLFKMPELPTRVNAFQFVVDPRILQHEKIADAVKANFLDRIKWLKQQGCHVEYRPIDAFQQSLDLIDQGLWLGSAEAFTKHEALLDSEQAEQIDPRIRQRLERSRNFPASKQIRLYFLKQQLQQQIQQELQGCLLLTPTVMHTAPEIAPLEQDTELFFETNARTLRLTMPGSFLDMPAVTLPNGFCEKKRPTAWLISSFSGDDQRVLQAAYAIEQALQSNSTDG